MRTLSLLVFLPLLSLVACGDEKEETQDSAEEVTLLCTEPTVPSCLDSMIVDLSLQTDVSDASVTTTQDGADFVTVVDATAGGSSSSATRYPWVYIKFSETGATRVDVDDQTAAESSMDWDMALRRFYIRLNGGDGGPGCVGADDPSGTYAEITSVPSDASYELEDFYSDECTLTMDSYEMSPMFTLYDWWTVDMGASMCVQTSLVPYLIQLQDGRVVKLVVEAYYLSGQEACNAGEADGWDAESDGNITLRWSYLD